MRCAPCASAASDLGLLVGRRRRAEVDALEVLWDVDGERVAPERVDQPGVGAVAALVPGDVEAAGAAEPVGDHGVQVRRGRLLGHEAYAAAWRR